MYNLRTDRSATFEQFKFDPDVTYVQPHYWPRLNKAVRALVWLQRIVTFFIVAPIVIGVYLDMEYMIPLFVVIGLVVYALMFAALSLYLKMHLGADFEVPCQ